MNDVLEYVYKDKFRYISFLYDIFPYIQEYLDYPTETYDVENPGELEVENDAEDFFYEINDMFLRLGIDKYNGKKNFVLEKDLTYVECLVSYGEGKFRRYGVGTIPVNVTLRLMDETEEIMRKTESNNI